MRSGWRIAQFRRYTRTLLAASTLSLAVVVACAAPGEPAAGDLTEQATPPGASSATLSSVATSAPSAVSPAQSPTANAVPSATADPAATQAAVTAAGTSAALAKLGSGLHDFTLPDAHGGSVTLSQYLGKKTVVLTFYRAWW